MIQKFYQTREFAGLCGVTKHTLFHYDHIGLLRPAKTDANGYRYYTADQLDKMLIISTLREAGSTLAEIRDYLECQNPQMFLSVLREKRASLEEEAEKLRRMHALLSDAIASLEDSLEVDVGVIRITESPEEYLIATVTQAGCGEEEAMTAVQDHMWYCTRKNLPVGLHIGSIIHKEDTALEAFGESFYFSRLLTRVEDERLLVKPSGTYAVMYHKGNYDTLGRACRSMLARLADQGWAAGDIYEEDTVDSFAESNPDNYILRLSVRVWREKEKP